MLFVNHDELQILEQDVRLDDRVCADDDFHGTICQPPTDRFFLRLGRASDQQADFAPLHDSVLACKQTDEVAIVLFRQNGSRRHDCGLRPVIDNHRSG